MEDENDYKLILEDYSDNYIAIYYNEPQCIECNISPVIDKYHPKNIFSMSYKKCYRDFHQYKLNYYKQEDKEFKNPLQLKKDFFIFDYKEYCQQNYLQENEESKRAFYEYIEGLFLILMN